MSNRLKIALAMLASAGLGAMAIQGLHQAKPPAYVITEVDIIGRSRNFRRRSRRP
jgi:hypothetical protein